VNTRYYQPLPIQLNLKQFTSCGSKPTPLNSTYDMSTD